MMHTFSVWAPAREKLEVCVGTEIFPMEKSDGWWAATLSLAQAECDYGFYVDGQGPVPDPRSPWQPRGVHELSRTVNHRSFIWTDDHWQAPPLSSAIIYELHIGTFTHEGTFAAAIPQLDHLVELGVTHVELMPVNEFPGERGWGYDGVDLFAPHHDYGGPDGLKVFVNACHHRRLAVLLDVVYNHLGPAGNYLAKFAPYFTPRYSSTWGPALNYDDADNGEVRRFFCDNALMWLRDYHMDGLRLDAVHAIADFSAIPFLEQLGAEVKILGAELGRHFVLIPESDLNDPRLLRSRECGGFALDAQWSDDFHHALHTVLSGEKSGYYADFGSLEDLAKALQDVFVYDGRYSAHRRRTHGRPATGLEGFRFLGYLQNHDQIGNRAQGERSSALMSLGRLKIGAALVLTAPFIPMLFQGEEWGATTPFLFFTDHAEELGEKIREGRRREFASFGWKADEVPDPQALATFERSKLIWTELSRAPHRELIEWHRGLIHLRRNERALSDGRRECVKIRFNEIERWMVVERGPITVACNLGTNPAAIQLRLGQHRTLLESAPDLATTANTLLLPPDSVAVTILEER